MISFPKRNVAQPIIHSTRGDVVVSQPQLPVKSSKPKPSCHGAIWNDKLYPSELWQMHDDLDKMVYGKLPEKELDEIRKRICGSLRQAETKADDQLFKFVQDSVNSIGLDKYASMLKQAMTQNAQILLALRCYAAATSSFRARDTIEIYSNTSMNSIDFFPNVCRIAEGDIPYVADRPESDDDPYWRSKNHSSSKHRKVRSIITDPEPTEKDKMPPSMADQMIDVLGRLGIKVQTNEGAWAILNNMSKTTSIEDRIIARIAYLIMNATYNTKAICNTSNIICGPKGNS